MPHLDMVVHLEEDGAGWWHVPVTLPDVLDGAVVEVILLVPIPGQGARVAAPGQGAAQEPVAVFAPEVCELI